MKIEKTFTFDLKNGMKPSIEAVDEDSARRKLLRRRNKYGVSYSRVYQAELINTEETSDEDNTKAIYKKLHKLSTSFKKTYIEKVDKFERKRVSFILEKYGHLKTLKMCYDQYGEEVVKKNHRGEDHTVTVIPKHIEETYYEVLKLNRLIKEGHLEQHFEKNIKKAEKTFESKLLKLSLRLSDKEFTNKVEIKSASVGVNFEATLVEGDKTVSAYTIIAEGEIQRPHYRYLIK